MIDGHFFLAPSGAGCTVRCAAAPMLQAKYPEDKEHPVTKEGIAMHWAAASELRDGKAPGPGTVAPNGVILDAEMLEAVDVYTDDVYAVLVVNPGAVLHVEELVHNDALHPTANGGTPDAWAVCEINGRRSIPVWDFKGGHGIVEVYENWQVINYAALILRALNLNGHDELTTYFDFRIVQPRAYHMDGPVRSWVVNAADLRTHWNRLTAAYQNATAPHPTATPGPHCKENYCTAAGRGCNALNKAAWGVVDVAYTSHAHDMTPADLGLALHRLERAKKMLDAQVDGMKTQALAMITRGDTVPYYGVKSGLGRERVQEGKVDEFIIVGEAMGIDVSKPRAAITPKQARAKGMPDEVVSMYAEQLTGEKKLVPEDALHARRVFGK